MHVDGGQGDGAGPDTLAPVRSKIEPWHGHLSSSPSGATVHFWCVQTADNATTVPASGCSRMIGSPSAPVAEIAPPTGMSSTCASAPPFSADAPPPEADEPPDGVSEPPHAARTPAAATPMVTSPARTSTSRRSRQPSQVWGVLTAGADIAASGSTLLG